MRKSNQYTIGYRQNEISLLLNKLYTAVEKESTYHVPHPGKIIASHKFNEPYPIINETDLLSIAVMDLLTQYAYPSISGYSKFTIQLSMKRSFDEINFTLGPAIPLTFEDGEFIPKSNIYDQVYRLLFKYIEKYDGDCILGITIIIFMLVGVKDKIPLLSSDAREKILLECLQPVSGQIDPISALKIQHKKLNYPRHITGIKSSQRTGLKSFLVADTETILIDNVHNPYAAGVMMVIPGLDLKTHTIYTYFSEDYTPYVFKSFEERSQKLLNDFILRIISIIKQNPSIKTVYFHNFSRFDGLFVLKHLALHHKMFKLKPLRRDNILYEVAVYSGKRMLFRLRDSLHLLPGKLDDLAKNLCPELGSKGSIPYDQVTLSNLSSLRESLVEYMKQDILLLGGIMHNFQDLYAKAYKVDIENKITAASLALSLFRSNYYDEVQFPIHIPNKNEDTFIRRGYYGGHADAYTPYGENLYYYDINSLYPFVMKEFPMPGGVPVWHSDLDSMELDSMFGFIQAYVECPKTMKRPFLPYRNDKDGILLFPTGEFVGVYYSEELKYARDLGYKVLPICGYLFQKMESPFKDYVNSLFECRSNAKKQGNNAIGYVYKLLLNSLYGRFGINPISTITEMCDKNRRDSLLRTGTFINEALLREDLYMVSYHSNMERGPDYWKPPKNSAIQLAAAITASARIYMYKYISREDCYYTDTDSIVLGNPLPEDFISSSVLGKFKLEDQILKGYFLAPKCYCYTTEEDDNHHVMRFKGAAKSIIKPEWFEQQYADPYRTIQASVTSNFRRNWSELEVIKKESTVTLRIALNRKRIAIIQDQKWLDTDPIEISDLSALDNIGIQIIRALRKKINQLETEKSHLLNEIFSQKELEIADKKRIREISHSSAKEPSTPDL